MEDVGLGHHPRLECLLAQLVEERAAVGVGQHLVRLCHQAHHPLLAGEQLYGESPETKAQIRP